MIKLHLLYIRIINKIIISKKKQTNGGLLVNLKIYSPQDFPGGAVVKNLPANAGDRG